MFSNAWFSQLLNELDGAVLLFDASGRLVAANDTAREYCAAESSEPLDVIWRNSVQFFDTVRERPLDRDDYPDRKLLREGGLQSKVLLLASNSGERRVINVLGEVIKDAEGDLIGGVLRMHDLAVRRHAGANGFVGAQRPSLQEHSPADLELESFIYSVSHDLQASLRHILGFSGLLSDEYKKQLEDEGHIYVQRIRSACRKMQDQMFALLQLSRETRGRMFWGSVNLSDIAHAVVKELREQDPERNAEVHIENGLEVYGDQRLLIVLIEHLIENAWKFTASRDKAVISFSASDINGGGRIFHIADNGVGFNTKRADKLFLPFRRYHGSEFPGHGIGLATALRVINRHNGKIWIESEPDKGAKVHFTLGR